MRKKPHEQFFFQLNVDQCILSLILNPHNFTDTYDWKKCAKFSLYGSLYVAPTLYAWVKLTSFVFPVSNFRTGIAKAVLEQFSYGPAATASFFFFMSLLDNKTIDESKEEVRQKFLPTMKVMCAEETFVNKKFIIFLA